MTLCRYFSAALKDGAPRPPRPLAGLDVPGLAVDLEVVEGEGQVARLAGLVVLGLDPRASVGDELGADLGDLVGCEVLGQIP